MSERGDVRAAEGRRAPGGVEHQAEDASCVPGPSGEESRAGREGGGRPARGYSWAPFQPGNVAGLRHGAGSERKVSPIASRLAAELAETAPWTSRPAFAASVAAWSRAEARVSLVAGWLDEHGLLDPDGEPRGAAAFLVKLESQAANLRARLGLDPAALAGLLAKLAEVPGEVVAEERERLLAEARALVEGRPGAA